MQPKPASQLNDFIDFLGKAYGLHFQDYDALHLWSISNQGVFWESISRFFDVSFDSPYKQVFMSAIPFWESEWFCGSQLSYAKHIFKHATEQHPALIFQNESEEYREISWNQMITATYSFQQKLIKCGVQSGDYVVCYGVNSPETIAAFLATNALGAVWSSCPPDFGSEAVVDRFSQLKPKVLVAHSNYVYNGKKYDCSSKIKALQKALTSIEHTLPLEAFSAFDGISINMDDLVFSPVPFSAPIWVLFSSGTTGKPKALVHGTGHMLLEHLKALGLHQDVRSGDRYFWYSTTGWMMWNYALSSMLCGATLCLFQGSPKHPNESVLWRFAHKAKINHFGSGAVYFQHQMESSNSFLEDNDFSFLKTIGSTGSPLSAEVCLRLQQQFPHTQVISLSGGTDVCTAFVGGHPDKPVNPNEIQCKMLGAAVAIWDTDGNSIVNIPGELVLTAPLLSMPICLVNDPDFKRYKESYFSKFDSVWCHGDWASVTTNGGVVIYGRSDATLNRNGVRIGTAELYAAMDQFEGIDDTLIIHLQNNSKDLLLLFVQSDNAIDKKTIKTYIRTRCSPRHVPDEIYSIDEIPYTISGKKVEIPVKRMLEGEALTNVISLDALRNPKAMALFQEFSKRFNS